MQFEGLAEKPSDSFAQRGDLLERVETIVEVPTKVALFRLSQRPEFELDGSTLARADRRHSGRRAAFIVPRFGTTAQSRLERSAP
jgi:hypothetical protein